MSVWLEGLEGSWRVLVDGAGVAGGVIKRPVLLLQISAEDGQIIFYEEFATGAQEAMKAKGAKKKKK